MHHRPWTRGWDTRVLPAAVFLTAAIMGTGLPGVVAADPQCRAVQGHETFQVQPSGALTVRFTGGIQGQSVLTDQVIFDAPDVPNHQIFIETFALTLKDGTQLTYTNVGVFDIKTFKTASLDTFIAKEGVEGFFGQLQEQTQIAPDFQSSRGTYRGEICLEEADGGHPPRAHAHD
jgi:hypothetical protein